MRDLTKFLPNPRQWWFNATHAPCPVCSTMLEIGREWHEHKRTHDRAIWRAALGLPAANSLK